MRSFLGRSRERVFGTPVAASARWRPMERSRNCPTHPPPKSRAKPQGGWVGETSLGRRTDGQGALETTCPAPGQSPPPPRVPFRAQVPSEAVSWPTSSRYCWLISRRPSTLAVLVALQKLPRPPAPLALPTHLGRLRCVRETAPPGRPKKPSQAAGRVGGRDKPRAPHQRPRRFGKGKS